MSGKIKCNLCEQKFTKKGMHTHILRTHGTPEQQALFSNSTSTIAATIKNRARQADIINRYQSSPHKCKQCNSALLYKDRNNKFCDKSCAAKFNNLHRSSDAKKPGPARKIKEPKPEFSTLYKCVCKHCGLEWRGRFDIRVCDEHKSLYSHSGRAQFWFTFGISKFPDLFDGMLIKQYGMRSRENPNGVTRDHRVSVQEAIANGYDPYYIKHPLNCELMLFKENASKHTRSSMTYEELVKQVNEYEKNKVG